MAAETKMTFLFALHDPARARSVREAISHERLFIN